MSLYFHPAAERELREAVEYYEDIEPGLGYDLSVEVYSAIQRAAVDREMRQERLDLRRAHVARVLLVMEEDEAAHPADIGIFGATAVVASPDSGAELVEELGVSFVTHNVAGVRVTT